MKKPFLFLGLLLFISLSSLGAGGCPSQNPPGFTKTVQDGKTLFVDEGRATVAYFQCEQIPAPEQLEKASPFLGEIQKINSQLWYLEVHQDALGTYVQWSKEPMQISLVAKNPEALTAARKKIERWLAGN